LPSSDFAELLWIGLQQRRIVSTGRRLFFLAIELGISSVRSGADSVCVLSDRQHIARVKCVSTRAGAGLVASTLIGAFLFALVLAAAPRLHAWVHPDSNAADHECAVTLIASGSFEHGAAPVMVRIPQPAQHFATIPTFTVAWVAATFSGAAIFEHAPPALS
jgi:hypothetical protein